MRKMASKATSKGSQKLFTCKQCKEPFTQPQGKGSLVCETCEPAAMAAAATQPQESSPQWVHSITAGMNDLTTELQASRQDRERRMQETEPAWAQALTKSVESLVQVVSVSATGPPPAKKRSGVKLVPALLQSESSDEERDFQPDADFTQFSDIEQGPEEYLEEDAQGVEALIRAVKHTLDITRDCNSGILVQQEYKKHHDVPSLTGTRGSAKGSVEDTGQEIPDF